MDTNVKNLQEVFQAGQRILVPLFQRPYVWNEEKQWAPLWEDIERLAGRVSAEGDGVEPHFMGAVVLQKVSGAAAVQTRSVIDGQQRLTTLQLIFHAAFRAIGEYGIQEAEYLRAHFRNSETFLGPADRYKLTPTTRDQQEYLAIITTGEVEPGSVTAGPHGLLTAAHSFFLHQIRSWLERGNAIERAKTLTRTLIHKLTLVAIELEHNEDSQQIFETLNARGTPLTGADLIKNFVFQRLDLDQPETESMYQKYWAHFETAFWEKEVSVGRVSSPRISLYLSQWLIAQTGSEVPTGEVFRKFKQFADQKAGPATLDMLSHIDACAVDYRSWSEAADDKSSDLNRMELFAYRTSVLGTQSAGPLLIWALDARKAPIPQVQLTRFLVSLESWLVRRALMRSGNAGIGQFVAALITRLEESSRDFAGDVLTDLLTESSAPNLAWPSDKDLKAELLEAPVYKRFRRSLLQMVLESVEDHLRGYGTSRTSFTEGMVRRGVHSIEHLLPQSWRRNWSVGDDVLRQMERDKHIHRLGNLTLVAGGLNSRVSNGPWAGPDGKLQALNEHSVLLLNQQLGLLGADGWDEEAIDKRTSALLQDIFSIWPVPERALGISQGEFRGDVVHDVSVADLIKAGLLTPGQEIYTRGTEASESATILANGSILVLGVPFETPSGAAKRITGRATNGWTFWVVDRERGITLATLRSRLEKSRVDPRD
ncbi:GmrSD restriction endonuclease domain-containing protein [Pseudarthrobacter sp. C1]|uniref:GmrSD restriction endonuclease domain-containing protein n=1 Tax=Pseudarthrobacter sp. C1 TaxID=3108940 RepID=UPI002B061966|nr:DUF262 domain-containing protein [Pseudarthrobacter sp. C1]MEA3549259.1 DUF262 domain-containing protein [Pseudarthrobacter sp. C1]